MAQESEFVEVALAAIERAISPPLSVRRGEALLYQVTVDNKLALTVDPRRPVRGRSAFETDLAVFEEKTEGVLLPRVVVEVKMRITTHDVLTYSAKARKHKQVYPYLRYGIVASGEAAFPGRVFTHNEALDFFAAWEGHSGERLDRAIAELIGAEVAASRRLEAIGFGGLRTRLFRTEVIAEETGGD